MPTIRRSLSPLLPILLLLAVASLANAAQLAVGAQPPKVTPSGKSGGRLDGKAWSSEEMRGKVQTFFYVDPDEKDTNEHVYAALRKENFPKDTSASVAVINMAATWKPNMFIASALKDKQKKYPDTLYLKDFDKTLVRQWGLADDASVVVALDKDGRVLFSKAGKLTDADIAQLVAAVRGAL